MCEYISATWREWKGIDVDPLAIWESSPTGELSHVVLAYYDCRAWREREGRPRPEPASEP